jgi:N-acetylmuramoyl-L-alanine amidase
MRAAARTTLPPMTRLCLCLLAICGWSCFPAVACASGTNDAVSLAALAAQFGFPAPVQTNATLTLQSAYSTFVFHANSRRLLYDGVLLWLNGPASATNGLWTIDAVDCTNVFNACLRAPDVLRGQDATLVVLDAGHGGADPGAGAADRATNGAAVDAAMLEKAIVLDLAQRVAAILEACDIAVKLTRHSDRFLTLDRRARLARRWGADAFVSIHVNHAPLASATGIETYIMPSAGYPSTASRIPDQTRYRGNFADAANTLLGLYIHRELVVRTGAVDRGLKRARFEVLRATSCPAALVECGFLSNADERSALASDAYRQKIAQGIARGIVAYCVAVEACRTPQAREPDAACQDAINSRNRPKR